MVIAAPRVRSTAFPGEVAAFAAAVVVLAHEAYAGKAELWKPWVRTAWFGWPWVG
jgi:hypothetical protein